MEIYYGDGKVDVNYSGKITAFEIKYLGKFSGECTFPEGWVIGNNKNKIIGVFIGEVYINELFSYSGEIIIKSCKLITLNQDIIKLRPVQRGVDFWEYQRVNIENFNSNPENFNNNGKVGRSSYGKSSLKHIGLQTKPDEFFYINGESYFGKYHVHGNGQAMTGEKHTNESKNIYRKNNKGLLPKEKRRPSVSVRPSSRVIKNTSRGGY